MTPRLEPGFLVFDRLDRLSFIISVQSFGVPATSMHDYYAITSICNGHVERDVYHSTTAWYA